MNISAAYYSSIGGRDQNEDSLSLQENKNGILAIVADGLGGHANGEIASKIAVNTLCAELGQTQLSVFTLEKAISKANQLIIEDVASQGMKSTVAVVWMDGTHCLAATVGDTRIYQIREGEIIFQSRDHSVTQMEVLAGDLKEEEIRGNKDRNRLIRALGAKDDVKPDIVALDIKKGDAFLLCSDGFWENIWEEEMVKALNPFFTATKWLEDMRILAESRMESKCDNHTAISIILKEC